MAKRYKDMASGAIIMRRSPEESRGRAQSDAFVALIEVLKKHLPSATEDLEALVGEMSKKAQVSSAPIPETYVPVDESGKADKAAMEAAKMKADVKEASAKKKPVKAPKVSTEPSTSES